MGAHQLIRSGVVNGARQVNPTLQHCLEAALSVSDSMVDELLDRLSVVADPDRPAFLPKELQSVDPALVWQLMEDADAIKATWSRHLRLFFFHGEGVDPFGEADVRFDDLRLLDDRRIDANIEFAMAQQELGKPTAELLPRLNALVSSLAGWMTVQADLNPIKPSAYARALRAVLAQHVPDAEERRALLMPVANIMGESLRQVYWELIQWLLAHGVEPLKSGATEAADGQPAQTAVGRTLLTLGRLRQLLAGDLNPREAGSSRFLFTVPLSMDALEDMDLIEPLMQRLREKAQQPTDRPAVAELPVLSGQNLGRLLGQEVVRLMLDKLTQDERLLPAVRQQIGLLEPALIKLSQTDPRFFSDRQHPARQLLESMTQRSLGYLSQNEDGFSDLLRSITAAVESLSHVEATEETFGRLLRRLRRRWEQDDERRNLRREEAARALLHAEQRQTLAQRLGTDFQQRMQDMDVPEFVRRFLVGPWALAVAEAQLSAQPPGSAGEFDELVDELLWSVQPRLIRRDTERLARLVPRLLGQLRQGLARIEFPPELTSQFFDALITLHERAFEQPARPAGSDSAPAPLASGRDGPQADDERPDGLVSAAAHDEDDFWMAGREAQDAGFVGDGGAQALTSETASPIGGGLMVGAWVDLWSHGQWVRAQLTWTSPRGSLFMFISASGMAHSMTRRTLDRLLGADALRIVTRGGVVEGALNQIAMQALREEGQAGGDGHRSLPQDSH